MTGTILNVFTILVGGGLGVFIGARLAPRLRETVLYGIGLFTLAFGTKLFLETQQPLVVIGSLLVGGLLGEWWRLETRLEGLGARLERAFAGGPGDGGGSRFVRGFLTASLLFCVGPMTILGSIQDGLTGDYALLAVKSVLDGFAALALASTLGVGVLFSVLVVLSYQGGLSLLAAQAQALLSPAMVQEMTAVGGVIILGLGVSSLLEIKRIRTGNLLPALFLAPAIVALLARLGLL